MQVWLDSAAASCCVFRLRVLCQAAGRCAQLLRDVPQGPGLPAYLAWCPWSVHCLGGSPALRGPKPRARVWLSSWVTPPVDGPPRPGGLGEGKGAARCWPWAKRRGCGLTGRAGPGKRRGCRPGPAKEPAGRWRGAGLLPLDPAWTGHLQGPRACVHRGGAGLLTTRAPPQARGRGGLVPGVSWALLCPLPEPLSGLDPRRLQALTTPAALVPGTLVGSGLPGRGGSSSCPAQPWPDPASCCGRSGFPALRRL